MNVNKKIFFKLIIFITLFFVGINNLKADNIGVYNWGTVSIGSSYVTHKCIYINGVCESIYCTQLSKDVPNWLDQPSNLTAAQSSGVTHIINSNLNYLCKEWVITDFLNGAKFLRQGWKDKNVITEKNCGANNETILKEAKSIEAKIKELTLSSTKLKFTKKDSKYKATINYTSDLTPTCTVSSGTVAVDTKNKSITVASTEINKAITLSCSVSYNYNQIKLYKPTDSSKQEVVLKGEPKTFKSTKTAIGTTPTPNYTVTYNANGGSGAPSAQTKYHGKDLMLSSTKPTRTGYVFSGWNTKADGKGTNYNSGGTYTSNSNVTLYAQWVENKLTVYYYNGANRVETYDYFYDNAYQHGLYDYTSLSISKTGYTGTGYWKTADGKYSVYQTPQSPVTGQQLAKSLGKDLTNANATVNVYAQWTPNTLTINYYSNGADFLDVNSNITPLNPVKYGQNVHISTSIIKYNATYDWDVLRDYNWKNKEAHADLYMTYTGHTYKKIYDQEEKKERTGWWGTASNGSGINIHHDKMLPTGQDVAKALGKDLTTGNYTINLYALWTPITYKIIYHGNGGYIDGNKNLYTDEVKYNESYTIIGSDVFKREDNIFLGWNTKKDGTGSDWTGKSGIWTFTNENSEINNKNELHLYAMWQDLCVYEFENTYSNNPTPLDRLNLYRKYHNGSWNSESRRNLLNFTIKDAKTACGNYTPVYNPKEGCLNIDQVDTEIEDRFTHQNISDYNDRIISEVTTNQTYCLTDFELTRGENVIYDKNIPVKAGRLVLSLSSNDNVATGILSKVCYIHKDEYSNYVGKISDENFININEYISTVTLDGVELIPDVSKKVEQSFEGDFYKVEVKATITYKPNAVYAEKITGQQKTKEECLDNNGILKDSCRFLGYGVASKFNDAKVTNPSFNFSIIKPINVNNPFQFDANGNSCEYKVEEEVIKYKGEDGNLDLEFRTIDTTKPFSRVTKSNWSFGTDNSEKNQTVKENITNSDVNNSYNRTGKGSLYTNQTDGTKRIILTPDLVQQIREYNNGTGTGVCANPNPSYNDYTVHKEVAADGTETTTTNFFKCIGLSKVQ